MVDSNTIGVSFPRRTGLKLNQIVNVSKKPAVVGDSLLFNAQGEWEPSVLVTTPGTNSITNAMLQDNIIGNAEMQDNAIGNAELQDNAVGTNEIANLAVTAGKIANNTITSSQMAAGAATDTVIGNRTITDTTVPSTDTNVLTTLLSNIANIIKGITGAATWRTAPAATIASLKSTNDTQTTDIATNTSSISTNATTMNNHIANTSNPHSVTIAQIGLNPQQATNNSSQTITNTISDISGATLTLAAVGTYLVTLSIVADVDQARGIHAAYINVGGTDGNSFTFETAATGATQRQTISMTRLVTTSGANTTVKGRIQCTTGSTSLLINGRTYLTAVQVA